VGNRSRRQLRREAPGEREEEEPVGAGRDQEGGAPAEVRADDAAQASREEDAEEEPADDEADRAAARAVVGESRRVGDGGLGRGAEEAGDEGGGEQEGQGGGEPGGD